jgi:hypothetical protein
VGLASFAIASASAANVRAVAADVDWACPGVNSPNVIARAIVILIVLKIFLFIIFSLFASVENWKYGEPV